MKTNIKILSAFTISLLILTSLAFVNPASAFNVVTTPTVAQKGTVLNNVNLSVQYYSSY